jgi:hypothetical protein
VTDADGCVSVVAQPTSAATSIPVATIETAFMGCHNTTRLASHPATQQEK